MACSGQTMADLWIVAVDPGGKHTGVVTMQPDGSYDAHTLLRRNSHEQIGAWCHRVTDVVASHATEAATVHAAGDSRTTVMGRVRIASEGLNKPTPQMGVTNVQGIIDTACVLGALMNILYGEVMVIPPARHGTGPRQAYPDQLWSPREHVGQGELRHCRAAWDVALAARTQLLLEQRSM